MFQKCGVEDIKIIETVHLKYRTVNTNIKTKKINTILDDLWRNKQVPFDHFTKMQNDKFLG
jgi:hypothetical protein